MGLEDLTGSNKYIDSLVSSNPSGANDPKSRADDHVRGIKNVLKNTFGFFTSALTRTPTQIDQNTIPGRVCMWLAEEIPEGWVLCNGQALNRTENQRLFNVIGEIFGGDGSTTFKVPNIGERFVQGADSSLGLGATDGEAEVDLSMNNFPAHDHTYSITTSPGGAHSHNMTIGTGGPFNAFGISVRSCVVEHPGGSNRRTMSTSGAHDHIVSGDTELAGVATTTHENRQPYANVRFIIKL